MGGACCTDGSWKKGTQDYILDSLSHEHISKLPTSLKKMKDDKILKLRSTVASLPIEVKQIVRNHSLEDISSKDLFEGDMPTTLCFLQVAEHTIQISGRIRNILKDVWNENRLMINQILKHVSNKALSTVKTQINSRKLFISATTTSIDKDQIIKDIDMVLYVTNVITIEAINMLHMSVGMYMLYYLKCYKLTSKSNLEERIEKTGPNFSSMIEMLKSTCSTVAASLGLCPSNDDFESVLSSQIQDDIKEILIDLENSVKAREERVKRNSIISRDLTTDFMNKALFIMRTLAGDTVRKLAETVAEVNSKVTCGSKLPASELDSLMTEKVKCIIYGTENGSNHLTLISNRFLTDTIEVFKLYVSNVQDVVQNKKVHSKTTTESLQNMDVKLMKSILLKKLR